MGHHFQLQGLFLTQGVNPGLLHCRQISLPSEPPGKPTQKTNAKFKKNAQRDSCELSFILGKMKWQYPEDSTQAALRNCSKEVMGRSVYLWFWWKGIYAIKQFFFFFFLQKVSCSHQEQLSPWKILVFFYIWRDIRIGLIKLTPEITDHLRICSVSFSQSTEYLISALLPWTRFRVHWESAAATVHDLMLIEVDGKCPWQAPICSWH